MKKLFGLLVVFSFVFWSCQSKEDVQKEERSILVNQSIQFPGIDSSWSGLFKQEQKADTYVALYSPETSRPRDCADCATSILAFEFDPALQAFHYRTSSELKAAKAFTGLVGGFAAYLIYSLKTGTITGQKQGPGQWLISFDLPADQSIHFEGFKKTAVYKVR